MGAAPDWRLWLLGADRRQPGWETPRRARSAPRVTAVLERSNERA